MCLSPPKGRLEQDGDFHEGNSGVSLKLRLGLMFAAVTFAAVFAAASLGQVFARDELIKAEDDYLAEQIAPLVEYFSQDFEVILFGNADSEGQSGDSELPQSVDWIFRYIVTDNVGPPSSAFSSEGAGDFPDLNEEEITLRSFGGNPYYRTSAFGETGKYRMLTVSIEGGGIVQIARSIDSIDKSLDSLYSRVLLYGIPASLILIVLGYGFGYLAVAPIDRLKKVMSRVGTSGNLDVEMDTRSRNEVGQMARSFNEMIKALKISREQQERLIQNAGHELKTPLTSISINLNLLLERDDISEEKRRKMLQSTSNELAVLKDLINETLAFSTFIEADTEAFERLDLSEVVDRVVDRARSRWEDRTISVSYSGERYILGSRESLERALTNILGNSVKFTTDDIEIFVDGAMLEVKDRGEGLPEEELEYVFERFYRAPRDQQVAGSGLGLAIVREIVENHGGTCFAKNREGGGLTVGFDLSKAVDRRNS